MGLPAGGGRAGKGKLTDVLSWVLQHGKNEAFLQRIKAQGLGSPKALESKPELLEDLRDVWNGWHHLNGTRRIGSSVSPLAMADVLAWLEIHGVPRHQRPWWSRMFAAMDSVFLAWVRKKKEAAHGDA